MYILDTNSCIYWMEGRSQSLVDRLTREDPADIGIPSIATAELWYGVVKSGRPDANRARLEAFLASLMPVSFDQEAARHFGEMRFLLEKAGTPIGTMDMLIAATALARDATLVSNNVGELSRVAGLKLEDWTIPD